MATNLVIVESPAKIKTIKKFLGSSYQVVASYGHVRDLPKSQLGVDIENDFEPKYITIRGKGELLSQLRKEVKKADKIFLATDPDREGEAISWHLVQALNLKEKPYVRITFNEITKDAVKSSIKNPRDIDQNLVDAQQARRVIDRVVGYQISPILWEKVKWGLSAGRVQSVALRIICDREKEIAAFVPEEYWTIDVKLGAPHTRQTITAHYYGTDAGKDVPENEEQVRQILEEIDGVPYVVREAKRSARIKNPPAPFTTSTMQQEAAKQLNFSTQKTMRLAQQLYEGVSVKGHGTIALITYLRTDSTRVSDTAQLAAKDYIEGTFGKAYLGSGSRTGKSGSNVQDAHEAIRPTDITLLPSEIKDSLERDVYRLYELIWRRFAASRMAPARYDVVSVKIACGRHLFTASDSNLIFDGFLKVYNNEEETAKHNPLLASLEEGTELLPRGTEPKQHFTQPPDHYTEASLVRTLEELGIGRPSTYAPTISTILSRHYIRKEKRALLVTDMGNVVNSIMTESFPDIVDLNFTATVESYLDEVEQGKKEWKQILREFYPGFEKELAKARRDLEKVQPQEEESDVVCEKCGRKMIIKTGRNGKFLACPGYPQCRNTRSIEEEAESDVVCEKCGRKMIIKTGRNGKFLACPGYPQCVNTKSIVEYAGFSCPQCGKEMVARRSKNGRRFYGCSGYPDCSYTTWHKPGEKKSAQTDDAKA